MKHTLAALLTIASLVCASACGSSDPDVSRDSGVREPADNLATRKARWLKSRPARFVVQTCTRGILPPGCLRAAVENGAIVTAQERVYGFLGADSGWQDAELEREPLEQMFDDASSPRGGCQLESVTVDDELFFITDYRTHCGGDTTGGRYVPCFMRDETRIDACDVLPEGATNDAQDAGG